MLNSITKKRPLDLENLKSAEASHCDPLATPCEVGVLDSCAVEDALVEHTLDARQMRLGGRADKHRVVAEALHLEAAVANALLQDV